MGLYVYFKCDECGHEKSMGNYPHTEPGTKAELHCEKEGKETTHTRMDLF